MIVGNNTFQPGPSSMPPSNPVKLVVPNGQKIYGKPNTPATLGPLNNPSPGANLPKNATRKPPVTGRTRKPAAGN